MEMVDREFSPHDGYYEVISGLLLILWALFGCSLLTNGPIPRFGIGMYVPIMAVLFIIAWVRLSTIRRKYPDVKFRDLNSDAMNKHEIIVAPVAFGVFMMAVVMLLAEITLPHKLGYHLMMFLAYATIGPTFLCSLALKYPSTRFTLWAILCPLICLTMVIYPNNWTRLYLKGGGLGFVMLIAGLITHLRFVKTLPPRQKKG